MSQSGPNRTTWLGFAGYIALLLAGIALCFVIERAGGKLHAPPSTDSLVISSPANVPAKVNVLLHVMATLAAVVALGYVLGRAFRYLGQPPVIGEIVAGILLGPSLLGVISPQLSHALIPPPEVDPKGHVAIAIYAVSQLGVVLYMFLVGLDLNATRLAGRAHAAIAVSHASIVFPFVLGMTLALWLYPIFSFDNVSFTSFALFMGVAMAVTAFPVLARILTDRGLHKTEIGDVALSCAAADDVTAWCLLALVVGVAKSDVGSAGWVIAGAIAFIALMFLIVRPILKRIIHDWDARNNALPPFATSATFLAVLLAALATEAIGIHAVFGAFLLGSVIPHDSRLAREFEGKVKDTVTVLLLPAFFAYTGMRTQFNLMNSWESWLWCGVIIFIATLGKFGGSFVAARFTGLNWRDSAALGVLMNTRGLMGLVVLNIGLDLGVISKTVFAMMVIMALVTTAATGPLMQLLGIKAKE